MESADEVTLQVENDLIICKKDVLRANSDYFKVMLDGNFVERHQTIITLHDVDYKSLSIILILLVDEEYILEEDDLLLVLQTACMLQFNKIRAMCIERVTEMVSLKNCLKIWRITESLDLKPLYLKAKNLSLIEFNSVKDTDCILDLNIKQLHAYLANISLCTRSELDVLATCLKWWYENSMRESFVETFSNTSELFYYFLSFVDFHEFTNNDINEIITYPDVSNNKDIVNILNDIAKLRTGTSIDCDHKLLKVNKLMNGRRRIGNNHPCVLIDGANLSEYKSQDSEDFFVSSKKGSAATVKYIMLFDLLSSNFKLLLKVPHEKHDNLEGFHMLGYKELIFFFGGEFHWGRGNWSDNFWVYDTIRERWERKTKMPYGRRHFESCIADNIVYIVGGTGSFRVLQDNMFWYNYKMNEWSKLITLPCSGRQIKCCEHKNELFLLNVNNKCGYIFKASTNNWIELKICDKDGLIHNFPEKFVVFSYEDFIYIKGSSIIKLKIVDNRLEVISTTFLKPINFDSIESVLCNGVLYTIYKHTTEDVNSIVFAKFDVSSCREETILEYDTEESSTVDLCGEKCRFTRGTKLFNLSHYSMVEEDTYLTDVTL